MGNSMTRLFLLIILSYFNSLHASEGVIKLATCLAMEEEQYHTRKIKTPEVKVTKELLELFAAVKDLKLREDPFSKVCSNHVQHKGLQLLKVILTYRKNAFLSTADDFVYRGFQKNFLDNLIRTSGQLFFAYLSSIQQQMPMANCLRLEIPQLKEIQDRFKVLEGDVDFDPAQLSQAVALLGLSDSANLVGFYENDSFQARIAYNWRDEFLNATTGGNNQQEPAYTEDYAQLDLSVTYNVTDNLIIAFEGINITEEDRRVHARGDDMIIYAAEQSARYALGVRYNF